MNTIIYIRSLTKGGAEKQSLILAKELQKERKTLVVVHHQNSKSNNHISYKEIDNIVFLKGCFINKLISLFLILKRAKAKNLICYLPSNNILGSVVGKIVGTKNILCGIRGPKSKSFHKMIAMKCICNCLNIKFISNSYFAKTKYIGYGFKEKNIFVIPNGILIPDKNLLINRSIEHTQFFKFLTVGRFVEEKGYNTLIESIDKLKNRLKFDQFELTIVGYGPLYKTILEKIIEFGLSEYIKIVDGQLANTNEEYIKADLYISTSIFEGMSNTIMEAMSFKLPIIATTAGDSSKLVVDNFNGFTSKIGDSTQIATSILNVISNPEMYQKFSNNSIDLLRNEYSATALKNNYTEILIDD